MAKYDNLLFYNINLARALQYWSIYGAGSSISGSRITLAPGGKASTSLSTGYVASSLVRAKYRRLIVQTETSQAVNGNCNYRCGINDTGVRVSIKTNYNSNAQNVSELSTFCLNPMMAAVSGYNNYYDFVFETMNYDLTSCEIEIENFSTSNITITMAQLFRSQDTTQLSDGTSVTVKLASLKAYYDGFEIGFSDSANPIKVWWMSDADGNFNGININNERLVPFSTVDGTLPGNML